MKECLQAVEEEIVRCEFCPRLVEWRNTVAREKRKAYRAEVYWGKPVPGFGDPLARVMVVGLAPGAHGSNRTGRMFTGDASGEILYRHLYRVGFSGRSSSIHREDGLQLKDVFITAVGRCVPPDNHPSPAEIKACLPYLQREMACLESLQGIVVLGRIAYDGIVSLLRETEIDLPKNDFSHGNFLQPKGSPYWVLQSYHPSRQNTQTGRLTEEMFGSVWDQVARILKVSDDK
jgi:uracil-DNA glycosylase family 4